MVEFLLDNGADINAKRSGGHDCTALQTAAFRSWIGWINQDGPSILKMLLDRGAQVNATGGTFGCALAAAAFGGWKAEEPVRLLLDHGASANLRGGGKYVNPLHAAMSVTQGPDPSSGYGHPAVVKMLVDAGAQIDEIPENYRRSARRHVEGGICVIM
jgi:ankyrin repeat protein